MFNSAAMFLGRRCSSQLEIPTLYLKSDDEDDRGDIGATRSRRTSFESSYHHRLRHSLPLASLSRTHHFHQHHPQHHRHSHHYSQASSQRPSNLDAITPSTPSTALAVSPETPCSATTTPVGPAANPSANPFSYSRNQPIYEKRHNQDYTHSHHHHYYQRRQQHRHQRRQNPSKTEDTMGLPTAPPTHPVIVGPAGPTPIFSTALTDKASKAASIKSQMYELPILNPLREFDDSFSTLANCKPSRPSHLLTLQQTNIDGSVFDARVVPPSLPYIDHQHRAARYTDKNFKYLERS